MPCSLVELISLVVPFAKTNQAPNALRMIELKLVIPDEVKLLLVEDWYHVVPQKKASLFVLASASRTHTTERQISSHFPPGFLGCRLDGSI